MRDRILLFVIGLWLGASVLLWVVASTNFRTVDAVLAPGYRSEFEVRLAPRTAQEERPLLRFLASELNRRFFHGMAWMQLAAAVLVVALAWPGRRWLPLSLLVTTALLAVYLTPQIRALGPPLDFVPRPPPAELAPALASFFRWHSAYMVADLGKLGLLLGFAFSLLRENRVQPTVDELPR